MSRLTARTKTTKRATCNAVKCADTCEKCEHMDRMMDKLADYEDKEEQGLITEVVRCKDCRYFSGGGLWDNGHWCGRTARVGDCDKVTENDFCSRAEALAKMGE